MMLRPDYSVVASEQLQKLSSAKKRLVLDVVGQLSESDGRSPPSRSVVDDIREIKISHPVTFRPETSLFFRKAGDILRIVKIQAL